MPIALFSIASSLHRNLTPVVEDPLIQGIQRELGESFIIRDDFSDYCQWPDRLIYIRTGGSEQEFLSLNPQGYVRLLTGPTENSLAAAMEILSYVNRKGGRGEILHGEAAAIALQLKRGTPLTSQQNGWIRPLPQIRLDGIRLGVIGPPSDWLIASAVDYVKAKTRLGVEFRDIPMDELVGEIRKYDCDLHSFKGSEAVYEALKKIVSDYALDGLTLRCFDLLTLIGNTGCLALARLNSEGVISSCEGDIPSLVTMMIAYKLTGCPGFQCNLSRISCGEMLFAHCTVPLSMTKTYSYTTHFESGIGTAIKAQLPPGRVTIFKVAPDLERMVAIPSEIVGNQSQPNLCRTQVIVRTAGAESYFLRESLANHHVIVPGEIFSDKLV